jgi:adenine deaminase
MTVEPPPFEYPAFALDTVKVGDPITEKTFDLPAPVDSGTVAARVMHVVENHVETEAEWAELAVEGGLVRLDGAGDVCKISVLERHGLTGERSTGLVSGLGFEVPAALATTVAHDSHNLMVMGNSEGLMARAASAVAEAKGGVAVATGDGLTLLPLPVAGLMSPAPYEEVAEGSREIGEALERAGCTLNYAFMTLSLLALVVLPELHVSDKGLVEVGEAGFGLVGPFANGEGG